MKTISTTYPADSITPLSVGATSIKNKRLENYMDLKNQ